MEEVTRIGRSQIFDLQEAQAILPTVQKITERLYAKHEQIEFRLQRLLMADPRRRHYQEAFRENITEWKLKMEGLGVSVNHLWQVKFNVGHGFLCWQFPELVISHFLPKDKAWDEKIKLKEYLEYYDPDWAY